MKEKCKLCMGIGVFDCEHSPQPEEWDSEFEKRFTVGNSVEGHKQKVKEFIKTEIRKAEENAKTNILRELKQMADKEVKISMVAGEIIQVRQLEVIQTVAKLHNIML